MFNDDLENMTPEQQMERALKIERMIMARRLGYDPQTWQDGLKQEVSRQREFESLIGEY
jgi:hypothetical protein